MIDLKAIKARYEAATEGPWWKIVLPWRDCTTEPYVFAGPTEDPHGGIPVADSPLHEAIESDIDNEANMTFIAHARKDLPDCVDEIERLQALVKTAHREGFAAIEGFAAYDADDYLWKNSEARKALESKQ